MAMQRPNGIYTYIIIPPLILEARVEWGYLGVCLSDL